MGTGPQGAPGTSLAAPAHGASCGVCPNAQKTAPTPAPPSGQRKAQAVRLTQDGDEGPVALKASCLLIILIVPRPGLAVALGEVGGGYQLWEAPGPAEGVRITPQPWRVMSAHRCRVLRGDMMAKPKTGQQPTPLTPLLPDPQPSLLPLSPCPQLPCSPCSPTPAPQPPLLPACSPCPPAPQPPCSPPPAP